ncbi:TPA: VaFE repeat-containing surface-anchored protein [Streptococcus equi subsp. zooepidemicus]|nr:VaFE repeat-containing surface-anchored protein [Streptococcus equi subsp. zooepidemicus]
MRKFKRLFSVLMAILIILGNIGVGNFKVYAASKTYTGYTHYHKKGIYFTVEDNQTKEVMPAFCFDAHLERPDNEVYEIENKNHDKYNNNNLVKEQDGWFAIGNERKILFNGYPTDAAGIKKTYNLSDEDFAVVTQRALWQQREGEAYDGLIKFLFETSSNRNNMAYAYNMLLTGTPLKDDPDFGTDAVGDNITLEEPPINFRVKLLHNNLIGPDLLPLAQRLAIIEFSTKPTIIFEKKDNRGKFVSGASFVLEKDGKEFKKWESKSDEEKLELDEIEEIGKKETYTLKEVSPPAGYDKASEIQFKIYKNQDEKYIITKVVAGKEQTEEALGFNYKMEMINVKQTQELTFKKVDDKNSPLKGAEFEIFSKDDLNRPVSKFTTDDSGAGNKVTLDKVTDYVLKETKVPNKYRKLADVNFRVSAEGKIELADKNNQDLTVSQNGFELTIKNHITNEPFIEVVKKDTFGKVLPGAKFKLTAKTEENVFNIADGVEVTKEEDPTRTKTFEINPKVYYWAAKGEPASNAGASIDIRGSYIKKEGNQITVLFKENPKGEDWGLTPPNYYMTVPTGLKPTKVSLKGSDINMANWPTRTRWYHTGNKYEGAYNRETGLLDDKVKAAKDKGQGIIINYETTGKTKGDFKGFFNLDGAKPGDKKTIVVGLHRGNYQRLAIAEFTIPGTVKAYNQVATWTSSDSSQFIKLNIAKETEFTLEEITPPGGYVDKKLKTTFIAKPDGSITMKDRGGNVKGADKLIQTNQNNPNEFMFVNEKDENFDIKISKKSSTGEKIKNIGLTVKNFLGEELEDDHGNIWFDSSDDEKTISVRAGKYTIEENTPPSGYLKFNEPVEFEVEPATGKVKITRDDEKIASVEGNNKIVLVNKKYSHHIYLNKVDNKGKNLENAMFKITYVLDNTDKTVFSGTEKIGMDLKPGKYILQEMTPPAGYQKIQDVSFEVLDNGTVKLLSVGANDSVGIGDSNKEKGKVNDVINIVNKKPTKEIKIAKQNEAYAPLVGAKIQIIEKVTNNVVATWVTKEGEGPHKIKVAPGEYIFKEVNAPKGYQKVKEFEFEVTETGEIKKQVADTIASVKNQNELTVFDKKEMPRILISKQNVAREEIADAVIQIQNKDGSPAKIFDEDLNEISNATWTSEANKTKIISLNPGRYKLHENSAPHGLNQVTDIDFMLGDDGKVTILKKGDNDNVHTEGHNKIVVVNATPDAKIVKFSKQNVDGIEIEGARIEILKAGKKVTSWTSEMNKTHEVTLEAGEYTFKEVAAPKGYIAITEFTFKVEDDGTVSFKTPISGVKFEGGKVIITNDAKENTIPQLGQEFEFSKQNLAGEELVGALIYIYKVEGDKETEIANWKSTTTPQKIRLENGSYIFKELFAPEGYRKVKSIKFDVKDGALKITDLNGNRPKSATVDGKKLKVIDDTDLSYKVEIFKVDVEDKLLDGAVFEIYNKAGDKVGEFTSNKDSAHKQKLKFGEYILKEKTTPKGHKKISDIKFIVNNKGISHLKMIEGDKEVEVATLTNTTGEGTNISDKLVYAVDYKLFIRNEKVESVDRPNGELQTTVGIGDKKASKDAELQEKIQGDSETKTVVDTVVYKNLIAGKKYIMTGQLMKIVKDKEPEQVGKSVTQEFTAIETKDDNVKDREVTIEFKDVTVEAGAKYVVYESAESKDEIDFTDGKKEKHTIEHKNPNDKAQTIIVSKEEKPVNPTGELQTTVKANGVVASKAKEATVSNADLKEGVEVVDEITYTGLVANEEYTIKASLMHIKADGTEEVKATKEAKLQADASGKGTFSVDFGKVTGLEVGEKYVVYEEATSLENLVSSSGGSEKDAKHKVEHKDKDDKAQTFVIESEKPNEPVNPDVPDPDEPVNPTGNKPLNPTGNNPINSTELVENRGKNLPKTGDGTQISLYAYLALLSGSMLLLLGIKKREEEK